MLRRLGRVEHVWYTMACAAELRQWQLRSSYVSIRMSGGAPVVVTTMETLAELRRSAHQAVHILAERRGPSGSRCRVSCQVTSDKVRGPGSRVDECRSRTRRAGGERPYAKV